MHGRRKNYRAWDAQQCSQEPVAPRDALPEADGMINIPEPESNIAKEVYAFYGLVLQR